MKSQSPRSYKQLLDNAKIRFIAAGLTNTVVDFTFFNLFIWLFQVQPQIASIGSTSIAMGMSYLLNKKLVFRSEGKLLSHQLPLFLLVTMFSLWVVQTLVISYTMPVLENLLNITSLDNGTKAQLVANGAKAFAIVASAIVNYILYSKIVFQPKRTWNTPWRKK